jgi:DNA-binding CsgD family transcriptional regulator
MEDLQIAYYLIVIMVGFAALVVAGFRAFKTQDSDLKNFCILYASFTFVLILSVLRKYLSINVENYSLQAWYVILGISQVANCIVIIALINFLWNATQIRYQKILNFIFLLAMLVCIVLIFSPIGATLDVEQKIIRLGFGFKISSILYFASFTFAIIVTVIYLKQIWKTEQRNFILGLLLFASFGYLESLFSFPNSLRTTSVAFGQDLDFLYSSIPYALYGFFLMYYFLHFSLPTQLEHGQLSESFLSTYNITDREREIILMVIQGKSNADIAGELVISLATVKTHLHNIYQKVGVDSRYDLLARVRSSQ